MKTTVLALAVAATLLGARAWAQTTDLGPALGQAGGMAHAAAKTLKDELLTADCDGMSYAAKGSELFFTTLWTTALKPAGQTPDGAAISHLACGDRMLYVAAGSRLYLTSKWIDGLRPNGRTPDGGRIDRLSFAKDGLLYVTSGSKVYFAGLYSSTLRPVPDGLRGGD